MKPTPLIETHALRIFLTMADERNMSHAAKRLGISQSAVSQTIRNLENQIGAILVNRGARPVTLTAAGTMLASRGAELIDALVDLGQNVADCAQGVKPDIRLGLVDSFAATCGSQTARALAARTTRLAVCTGLSFGLEQKLLRRELDLIVSSQSMLEKNAIVRRTLLTERFVAMIPKALYNGQSRVSDLLKLCRVSPLIRFDQQSHIGIQIEEIVRAHAIQSAALLEFDTSDTLTSMVAGGLGWAITTPLCALQARHLTNQIRFAAIDEFDTRRSLYLLSRAELYTAFLREAFDDIQSILIDDLLPRLRSLDPVLKRCIDVRVDNHAPQSSPPLA
ncbi:LysR family transcriptional regulator [Caballeronia sp. GAWG1-1]|uniref:LysR family transcriptional regulator n=1 Tax=Caballeronia sp. GAWG1-1 TaxID=2921742 RepID=UPI0020292C64|nr:LysR family transcriptional regulator [Caballeronia sp. GAWG1-1]